MRSCTTVARMNQVGSWGEYVQMYSQGDKQGAIAEKLGVQSSTVGRWLKGHHQPDASQVIDFARKYGRSPIEALIYAGFIEAEEVGAAIEIATSMRNVSDSAVLEELADRLAERRRLMRNDGQNWPPAGWGVENPGVGGQQDDDQSKQFGGK